MKNFGILLLAFLTACASRSPQMPDPLAGTWVFDAKATGASIKQATGWPDDWVEYSLQIYKPNAFTFKNGKYDQRVDDKVIRGKYSLTKLTPKSYRIAFTCPVHRESDAGVLTLSGTSFSYESDTPLLKGVKEIFRKQAE